MASKQQPQEIDVLDCWEQIEEPEIEQKLRKLLPPSKQDDEPSCNGEPINIILTGDDALRSQYVPPEPTVKILKRPTKDTNANNDNKLYHPKKSLQQREQEYAEARARILGEFHCDKSEEKVASIQNKSKPSELENIVRLPKGPDGSKGFNVKR